MGLSQIIRDLRFSWGVYQQQPFQVFLQVTNRCNMRCSFCDFWPNGAHPSQEMSLDDYRRSGGGAGLEIALGAWPDAVIEEVARSGLRGRGGAGFPTGEKWRSVRSVGAGTRFAVCNGAEGEPATFKDRLLLRTNPYQVLEGLAIAAYAVGAERAYIGVKETFAAEIDRVSRALEEMREADALGGIPMDLVIGPDLYLFGEETGLEEVIEGRLPLPRVARPFMMGLFAQPPKS